MPLVTIKVFENELSTVQSAELIHHVTEAVIPFVGESLRTSTWVVVEEIKSGAWGIGGKAFGLEDVRAAQSGSGQPPTIKPPFTEQTAVLKVQAAEDAWNSRDPERVALAYSEDSQWRNRTEFLSGRAEIRDFLRRKWSIELNYRLKKTLWCWTGNRIAVTFEYEWHDENQNWFRSYGNELWEFDDAGLMRRRIASINDASILESDRRIL